MIGEEFQKALYQALVDANVCGGRIYDRVPPGAQFPYATIGDEQVNDDSDTCQEGAEVFADIHVWSRPDSGSKIEVKREAKAARNAALTISTITDLSLSGIFHETTRVLTDQDGLTQHAVITVKAIVGPA